MKKILVSVSLIWSGVLLGIVLYHFFILQPMLIKEQQRINEELRTANYNFKNIDSTFLDVAGLIKSQQVTDSLLWRLFK